MVTHIVFWKLFESALGKSKLENEELLKQKLISIAGKIEGVISIEIGFNYNLSEESSDVAFILKCRNKEVLKTYDEHTDHQALKFWLKDIRYERRVIDFED